MATTPLDMRPTGDGTATGMTVVGGSGSYASAISEDPDSHDGDTSYVTPGVDSSGTLFLQMTDMPASFISMDAITARIAVRLNGTLDDDTTALYAQVFASNETTTLTEEVLVTDQASAGGTYGVDATAFSTINSPGDKTTWDGARLRLRWTYVKNMASDGIALRVTAAELASTLTTATSIPASASGSSSSSGSASATKRYSVSASGASSSTGSATARLLQTPTAVLELWESGAFVATLDTVNVPVTGEQVYSAVWDSSALGDIRGRDVELRVVMTPTGEGATAEVGAIEWNAGGQQVLTVAASASGSSTSSGSAAVKQVEYGAASGASTTSGAATALRQLVAAATGSSVSLGSTNGLLLLSALASGASSSSGSAPAYRRLDAAASGQTTATGSAAALRRLVATGSGTTASSGVATALRLLGTVVSGASTSGGAAAGTVRRLAASSGASTSLGAANALVPLRLVQASGASLSAGSSVGDIPFLSALASGSSVSLGSALAERTEITGIVPDTILAVTNLPPSPVADIQDDPASPDGDWLVSLTPGAEPTDIRLGFTSPPDNVVGEQTYRVLVRAR